MAKSRVNRIVGLVSYHLHHVNVVLVILESEDDIQLRV